MDNILIDDKELKDVINKLLSDAGVLLQIISNLQDLRYQYLTDAKIDADKLISEEEELEEKFQMIKIL